jgi:TMEM175 potassium channel family protein
MEGFSDGVYGFAATLLVLDLALHPPGTALEQVSRAWPGYLAYVVSFLTIGVSWLVHTALTNQLARVDQLFLRLNLLLLLVVVFLPFPTGLAARALHNTSGERVYVTMYGLALLAIRLLGGALDSYARYERLCSPAKEGEDLHSTQRLRSSSGSCCQQWQWRFTSVSRCIGWCRSGKPPGCCASVTSPPMKPPS